MRKLFDTTTVILVAVFLALVAFGVLRLHRERVRCDARLAKAQTPLDSLNVSITCYPRYAAGPPVTVLVCDTLSAATPCWFVASKLPR